MDRSHDPATVDSTSWGDSYAAFVRRYFPSVYRWCARNSTDREQTARAAQRIILELYRLEQDPARAS